MEKNDNNRWSTISSILKDNIKIKMRRTIIFILITLFTSNFKSTENSYL